MATKSAASYDAKDITVLEGLEAVRKRPAMYIGSTGPRGLHHLVWEVVDNAVDEAMAGYCTRIDVTVHLDNTVTVKDNGRGIPVDRHEKTKQSALTTVLTTLHAGGKFESGAYTVSGGLHGVGLSVVNALSGELHVNVVRDGFTGDQSFHLGKPVATIKKGKPAKKSGTTVTFRPDETIFKETTVFDYEIIASRLREMAFLNKGLEIRLVDERGDGATDTFKYSGGLIDFVKHLNPKREPLHAHVIAFEEVGEEGWELDVALQWTTGYNENLLSFANNINTIEGGTHEEGFRKALTRAINDFARERGMLKEKEDNLVGEDVREGLTAVVAVKLRQPQFEGQTKTKLGNTEIRSAVEVELNKLLPEWLARNPPQARQIIAKGMQASRPRMRATAAPAPPGGRAEPLGQEPVEGHLDEGADVGVAQLGLGLALELGMAHPHPNHRGEAFADVLTHQVLVLLLQQALLPGELVDRPGQRLPEPLLVGAPLVGVDVVGEGEHRLGVPGIPLEGDIHLDVVADLLEADDVRVQRLALGIEVLDEIHQAAAVAEGFSGALAPFIHEHDLEALVEKGHLAQAGGDRLIVELGGLGEDAR